VKIQITITDDMNVSLPGGYTPEEHAFAEASYREKAEALRTLFEPSAFGRLEVKVEVVE
jgi:hypothetical protein